MDALTRREFLKRAGLALAAAGAFGAGLLLRIRSAVRRVVRARPLGRYPGRIVPLDHNALDRSGPWAG